MPDTKSVKIGDILTKEQLKESLRIINESKDYEAAKKLKEYFLTIQPPLSEKGVLPDYFAYVLIYTVGKKV